MRKQTILITGNLGYIGVELSKHLKKKSRSFYIIGYDTGYFLKTPLIKKTP